MPTHVPTVTFTDERLANGLRVIVAEDHLAPVVAVNLWYDVGSKHETPGQDRLRAPVRALDVPGLAARRQGGAHRHRPGRRRHDQRAPRGSTGPTTSRRCRPHQLDLALWLEADRMATLLDAIDPGEPRQPARGRQEREAPALRQPPVRVVAREAAWRTCSRRSTRTTTRRSARWRTSTRPSLEDVIAFFRTWYAPNNAVLSIVGDVETGAARAAAERYFGPIPANPSIPQLGTSRSR